MFDQYEFIELISSVLIGTVTWYLMMALAFWMALKAIRAIWNPAHRSPCVRLTQVEYHDNSSPTPRLSLTGEIGGIKGWLLGITNRRNTSSLFVTDKDVTLQTSGFAGERHTLVPISSVSSAGVRLEEYLTLFFIGIALLAVAFIQGIRHLDRGFLSLMLAYAPPLAGGIIALTIFAVTKHYRVQCSTTSGLLLELAFKRGTANGAPIDFPMAEEFLRCIQKAIENRETAP